MTQLKPGIRTASRLRERFRLPDFFVDQLSNELLQSLQDTDGSIQSLLLETYADAGYSNALEKVFLEVYYSVRSLLSDRGRASLQRKYLLGRTTSFPAWPLDHTADALLEHQLARVMRETGLESLPFIWYWPNHSSACAIVTHDVETERGKGLCQKLIDVDTSFGIRGSFQIVPEKRYEVSPSFLADIRSQGFEVAVHDLNHDGRLFLNEKTFSQRIAKVNRYGKAFGSPGFRAGVMYRNQRWFDQLDFEFDMSVPNTARFEPQGGGCCSVMPYFIGRLLEIPLTTAQDYTIFHILKTFSPELWFQQVDAIFKKHGLISVLTHPDYIMEPKAVATYRVLLERLASLRERNGLWVATPCELNHWWRQRADLRLEKQNGDWRIVGDGADRASIAYAVRSDDSISYVLSGKEFSPSSPQPTAFLCSQ